MRLLTAISLALIVLMALACTATPAAPAPTSSGAFSCMELADKLATAQTETAARVLTSSWNESGCAQKAAGVTQVPTARPTARPIARPTLSASALEWLERELGRTPVPTTYTGVSVLDALERELGGATPVPTDTPVPPTDCVRVETTDARKNQSRAALSGYQLMLNWRVKNICDVAISAGQTIVLYDKDKNILNSAVRDSAGVLKLPPGESLLFSDQVDYGYAGGDAFHSYEIEVPWKPD